MEGNSSSSGFVSETAMVKCRICQTSLRKKNYKTHLKKVHPIADCEDLSGKDQQKISSMFFTGRSSKGNDTLDKSTTPESDQIMPVNPDDDTGQILQDESEREADITVDHSKKRKAMEDDKVGKRRRFESGDSAFSDSSCVRSEEAEDDDQNSTKNTKLDMILQELQQVKSELRDLKKPKKSSDEEIKESGMNEQNEGEEKVMMMLNHSRSVEELQAIGFNYDEESSKLKCVLCDLSLDASDSTKPRGIFSFSSSEQSSFTAKEKLSRNFINLKASVKKHIMTSKSHCVNLERENEKYAAECELESKNRKAGLNLGLAAMKNYVLGRPYTDYENDVLLMKKSGGVVGELNHSRKFPAKFRKSVCRVVNGRIKRFVKTPLKVTGFRPPVAISADKGTYKGAPRQFCGIVTVNPGGDNFLEVLTAGQPVVDAGSTGHQLAKNMKTAFDSIGVEGAQIKSGVFDGVYDHVDIKRHLGDLYPDMKEGDFLFTWDPLHRTGLADKHMCHKKGDHKWIIKFNSTCNQLYGTFSWGASHVKLREAAVDAGIKPRNLVNFSETRFANSKRLVYQIILDQFPAIMGCLQHYIAEGESNRRGLEASNRDVRDKADKAMELKGKIFNVEFLLLLAGLSDIYEQFGAVVQVNFDILLTEIDFKFYMILGDSNGASSSSPAL